MAEYVEFSIAVATVLLPVALFFRGERQRSGWDRALSVWSDPCAGVHLALKILSKE